MNPRDFNKLLRQSVFLPVLLLIALAAVLLTEVRATLEASSYEQQSNQVITQLDNLLKLIVDQETGLRGYQVTGDPVFLQPYQNASVAIGINFDQLRHNLATQPAQLAELAAARSVYAEWARVALNIQLLVATHREDRSSNLNLDEKQRMDDLRARFAAMNSHAATLRDERSSHLQKQVRRIVETTVGLTIFLGLIIGLLTRSQLHRVSDAYRELLKAANQREQELYASRQSYSTTLQSIGDAVISCDAEGHVVFMNQVAQDLCMVTQAEAMGTPLQQVFNIVNESSRLQVEDPVAKVRRLNRVVGLANHTVLLRRDGTEVNIDDSGAPILDQHGALTGVVLVFRDITQERKTAQALLANEKLAVAGRLSATIAHEIHNPLDSVANLLYLLRNEPSAEDAKRYLDLATQELTRVTQISRTMLSLYREPKSPILIDVKDLLESVLVLMDRKLQDSSIQLKRDMPETVRVEGFPAELRQVFTNLIANAGEAAGSKGEIGVALRSGADGAAIVEISDNGPGITDEVHGKLFAPFFTTKGEHGTGLGLWVSRGIVSKHGGQIEVVTSTDAVGHGTTMRVTLPAKASLSELAQTH